MQKPVGLVLTSVLLGVLVLYNGCAPQEPAGPSVLAEKPYCGTPTAQANSVTITGSAGYYYRTPVHNLGLSLVSSTTNPIRRAEFNVLNSAGAIVQCGETDGSGNFSFSVTQSSASYTIAIYSRSFNSYNKASILNDPINNVPYKITGGFVPDASKSIGEITASATGSLEGGAFNILDKILNANLFLLDKTSLAPSGGSPACTFSGTYAPTGQNFSCVPYSVDYKVHVYWKPGFNPGTYVGNSESQTLSFYDPTDDKLYICGGYGGDVDNTDTDHFDNSIIIHEYGHFVEAHYAKSDSPGGPHSGTKALDPRLMFSEGFANFFQGIVQTYPGLNTEPYYIDTIGNASGTRNLAFDVPLETGSFDSATVSGEGNFREFAITRALFDLADKNQTGSDNVNDAFGELWTAFTALKSLSVNFRHVGLLYKIQGSITGGTDFSTVYGSENQVGNLSSYGSPTNGGCGFSIPYSSQLNSYQTENWPQNGDLGKAFRFIDYYATGGAVNFTLNYAPQGNTRDVDMWIFREDHNLFYTSTAVGIDARSVAQDGGNLSVSANLSAGHYLIMVQNFGNSTGTATINYLRANGANICPGL